MGQGDGSPPEEGDVPLESRDRDENPAGYDDVVNEGRLMADGGEALDDVSDAFEGDEVPDDWAETVIDDHAEWAVYAPTRDEYDMDDLDDLQEFLQRDHGDIPNYDNPRQQIVHQIKRLQESDVDAYDDDLLNNLTHKLAQIEQQEELLQLSVDEQKEFTRSQSEILLNMAVAGKSLQGNNTKRTENLREDISHILGYGGATATDAASDQFDVPFPEQELDIRTRKVAYPKVALPYDAHGEKHENTRVAMAYYDQNDDGQNEVVGVRVYSGGEDFSEPYQKIEYGAEIPKAFRDMASGKQTELPSATDATDRVGDNTVVVNAADPEPLSDTIDTHDKPRSEVETGNLGQIAEDEVISTETLAERIDDHVVGKTVTTDTSDEDVNEGDRTHYYVADAIGAVEPSAGNVTQADIEGLEDDMTPPDIPRELVEVKRASGTGVNFGKEQPGSLEPFEDYDTDLRPSDNRYVIAFVDDDSGGENEGVIEGALVAPGHRISQITGTMSVEERNEYWLGEGTLPRKVDN